jgi:uncharacterized protein YcfL
MNLNKRSLLAFMASSLLALSLGVAAKTAAPAATAGIAEKLILRGGLNGLQVVDLRALKKNDVLVVQAEIQNTKSKDLRLYYRFRWTDEDGMQIGNGEVWKPLMFLGKQSQFIKGIAPGPKAADFEIEMSAEAR